MKYSIYRLSDGMIIDSKESDESQLANNVPQGCGYIVDHHDYLSVKVDLGTKELADYQPPAPSADHYWDVISKRWRLSDEVGAAISADANARRELATLDLKAIRYLIDANNGSIDEEGKQRLAAISAAKDELRKKLRS